MSDVVHQLETLFSDLRLLGEGATAAAYYAKRLSDGKECVVKVFLRSFDEGDGGQPLARFERECKALAHLQHPNIVKILEWGTLDALPYLVLEWYPSKSLFDVLNERRALPWRKATRLVAQLASGLAHAHHRQIVHRDIKPANILVKDDGSPLLIDFGLVRSGLMQTYRTATGVILGSPVYMAPELFGTERANEYTDVYSLVIVFYEMVTGEKPFRGPLPEIIKAKMVAPPKSLKSVKLLPKNLAQTIDELVALPHKRQKIKAAELEEKLLCFVDDNKAQQKTQQVRAMSNDRQEKRDRTASIVMATGNPTPTPTDSPTVAKWKKWKRIVIILLLIALPIISYCFTHAHRGNSPMEFTQQNASDGHLEKLADQLANEPTFSSLEEIQEYASAVKALYVKARQARGKQRDELAARYKQLRELIPKGSVCDHLVEAQFSPKGSSAEQVSKDVSIALSKFQQAFSDLSVEDKKKKLPIACELFFLRQEKAATIQNMDHWRRFYFDLPIRCSHSPAGKKMANKLIEKSRALVKKLGLLGEETLIDYTKSVQARAEAAKQIYGMAEAQDHVFKEEVDKILKTVNFNKEFEQIPAGNELARLWRKAHWLYYMLLPDEELSVPARHDYIELTMNIVTYSGKHLFTANYLDRKQFGYSLSGLECANRALYQLAHMVHLLNSAPSKKIMHSMERHIVIGCHRWIKETRTINTVKLEDFRRLIEDRLPKDSLALNQIISCRHYYSGDIKAALAYSRKALTAGRERLENMLDKGGPLSGDTWNIVEYLLKDRLGNLEKYNRKKEFTGEIAEYETWLDELRKKFKGHWRLDALWSRTVYILSLCRKPNVDDELKAKLKEAQDKIRDSDIKESIASLLKEQ